MATSKLCTRVDFLGSVGKVTGPQRWPDRSSCEGKNLLTRRKREKLAEETDSAQKCKGKQQGDPCPHDTHKPTQNSTFNPPKTQNGNSTPIGRLGLEELWGSKLSRKVGERGRS